MWFLLRRNIPEHIVQWLVISGIICCVHGLFLFFIFFIYSDGISNFSFVITPHTLSRIVDVRMAVETIQSAQQGVSGGAKKIENKKTKKATTAIAAKTAPQKKKAEVQKVSHAHGSSASSAQKAVPQQKKIEKEKIVTEKDTQQHALQIGTPPDIKGFETEFSLLYENIASYWSPPPGVPSDMACTLQVMIDRQGAITDICIATSSDMLIFDLAARAVLEEVKFPRMVWGKSLTITFTV